MVLCPKFCQLAERYWPWSLSFCCAHCALSGEKPPSATGTAGMVLSVSFAASQQPALLGQVSVRKICRRAAYYQAQGAGVQGWSHQ